MQIEKYKMSKKEHPSIEEFRQIEDSKKRITKKSYQDYM